MQGYCILIYIKVHQIAMLNFVLSISICLGLHFFLTQMNMTWAKIRENWLIFRGATGHLKNMKMDRLGCFPRKLKIIQEIAYEKNYFQKSNINLLLYKFIYQRQIYVGVMGLWSNLKFNGEHCNSLKLLKYLPGIDVLHNNL